MQKDKRNCVFQNKRESSQNHQYPINRSCLYLYFLFETLVIDSAYVWVNNCFKNSVTQPSK